MFIRRGRLSGRAALIWREVERLLRNPRGVVVLLVSAVVPYALLSLGLGNLTPAVSAIVLMFVMVPFFDSLRVLSRTRGLARAFPMSTSQLNGSLTVVPAVLALLWAIAAGPAFVLISDPRRARQRPDEGSDHGGGRVHRGDALGDGQVGRLRPRWWPPASVPLPPGLMFNLVRGFDVIALITLPVLFGWSPMISIVIAIICYMVLRSGGINTQDLMEQNEEAQRQALAAAKKGGGVSGQREKITYTRSKALTRERSMDRPGALGVICGQASAGHQE